MNYTEEKKMVMDCLSQFNNENENVAETLFNVYPAEMNALVRLVKNCRIANVSERLFTREDMIIAWEFSAIWHIQRKCKEPAMGDGELWLQEYIEDMEQD